MSEYNLSIRSTYSTITDTDLDALVYLKFKEHFLVGETATFMAALCHVAYEFLFIEYVKPNAVLIQKGL